MSQLLANKDDTAKSHIGIDSDIVPEFIYWIKLKLHRFFRTIQYLLRRKKVGFQDTFDLLLSKKVYGK